MVNGRLHGEQVVAATGAALNRALLARASAHGSFQLWPNSKISNLPKKEIIFDSIKGESVRIQRTWF